MQSKISKCLGQRLDHHFLLQVWMIRSNSMQMRWFVHHGHCLTHKKWSIYPNQIFTDRCGQMFDEKLWLYISISVSWKREIVLIGSWLRKRLRVMTKRAGWLAGWEEPHATLTHIIFNMDWSACIDWVNTMDIRLIIKQVNALFPKYMYQRSALTLYLVIKIKFSYMLKYEFIYVS